jgi:acylphosphatase
MVARRVRVTGRVQGVFFRAWTREQAGALGVGGWVRNRSDGSVEAHLEGDERSVDMLVERLRSGPSHARVDQVQIDAAEPESPSEFTVKH